jgi:hypothetical protein
MSNEAKDSTAKPKNKSKNKPKIKPMTKPTINSRIAPKSREMRFVLLPRFNMATLATMIEPMRIANYVSGETLYRWEFLTPDGSPDHIRAGRPG